MLQISSKINSSQAMKKIVVVSFLYLVAKAHGFQYRAQFQTIPIRKHSIHSFAISYPSSSSLSRLLLLPNDNEVIISSVDESSSSERELSYLKVISDDNDNDDVGNNGNNNNDNNNINGGKLILMTVPMAWGTFEPAVRYVYEIQPTIPPFVFQFVYYAIASTALILLGGTGGGKGKGNIQKQPYQQQKSNTKITTATTNSSRKNNDIDMEEDVGEKQQQGGIFLPSDLKGGLELGTYLFLGNGLQVIGLKTVASDRAAFLLQLTTIFVPIIQSLLAPSNERSTIVSKRTWIACFVALIGVAFIGLDGDGGGGSDTGGMLLSSIGEEGLLSSIISNMQFSTGDLFIALGAIFYSFHCIRLELYAKSTSSAINLAAAKATTETFWCMAVVATSVLVATTTTSNHIMIIDDSIIRDTGTNIIEYIDSLAASIQQNTISTSEWLKLGLATTWTGLITIAYTIYAQSLGQARVKATTANLIYTTQPLFTAIIAYIVLGERLGIAGYFGGSLIGLAVLLVVL